MTMLLMQLAARMLAVRSACRGAVCAYAGVALLWLGTLHGADVLSYSQVGYAYDAVDDRAVAIGIKGAKSADFDQKYAALAGSAAPESPAGQQALSSLCYTTASQLKYVSTSYFSPSLCEGIASESELVSVSVQMGPIPQGAKAQLDWSLRWVQELQYGKVSSFVGQCVTGTSVNGWGAPVQVSALGSQICETQQTSYWHPDAPAATATRRQKKFIGQSIGAIGKPSGRYLLFMQVRGEAYSYNEATYERRDEAIAPPGPVVQADARYHALPFSGLPFVLNDGELTPTVKMAEAPSISRNSWWASYGLIAFFETVPLNATPNPPPCTSCECLLPGTTTTGKSTIYNLSGDFIHDAEEWSLGSPQGSSCTPCGSGAAAAYAERNKRLLKVDRFHRYGDRAWPSSLSPGVFLDSDCSITANNSQIRFFDPSMAYPIALNWDAARAAYIDAAYGIVTQTLLYDANWNPLPGSVAMRAPYIVLVASDGRTWTFECFADAAGLRRGRLLTLFDRTGLRLQAQYAVPVQPAPTDLASLWQRTTLADGFGTTVSFSYASAGAQAWPYPCVDSLSCPGNVALTYSYGAAVDGLCGAFRVTGPTGDVSSVDLTVQADGTLLGVFQDAQAKGEHRNKTVRFSGSTDRDPRTLLPAPHRVLAVTNGAGEISYRRRLESQADGTWATVVDEGGSRILRLLSTWDHRLLRTDRAVAADWAQPTASYTWETERTYTTFGPQFGLLAYATADGQTVLRTLQPGTARALSEQDAAGTRTWERDAWGQPLVSIDRLGMRTEQVYDTAGNLLRRTVAAGTAVAATTQATYNGFSQILTETDPLGRTTDYAYDAAGRLLSVTEPPDHAGGTRAQTSYEYDAIGRLRVVQSPLGVRTTYDYDLRNRLVTTTFADGSTERVGYGTGIHANLPVSRTDRNGRVTTTAYDGAGRVLSVTVVSGPADLPAGQTQVIETTTYVPGTGLIATRRRDGELMTCAYDQRGRQTSVTRWKNQTASLTEAMAYDVEGRIAKRTDAYGRRTWYGYDAMGRQTRVVRELVVGALPAAPVIASLNRQTGVDPAYVIEDSAYDAEGRLIDRTDGLGIVTRTAYRPDGMPSAVTADFGGTRPLTTSMEYDAAGQRTAEISPASVRTAYAYTGRGLLWTVTEAAGTPEAQTTRTLTYDHSRQILTETDALGRITVYTYGGCCARLQGVADAAGYVTSFTYDAVGNRLTVTDPLLQTTTTWYDLRNRVTKVSNPLAKTVTFTYDENLTDNAGVQLDAMVKPSIAGLGMGSNANGRLVKRVDENGKAWYQAFDGLGRMVLGIDPVGNIEKAAYDAVTGGLVETAQINGLNQSSRQRADGQGLPRQGVDAIGKVSTAAFDAQGNRRRVRDALGIGQDMVYDAHGRLVQVIETRQPVVPASRRTYDDDGRLLSDMDATGAIESFVYDLRGRRLSLTDRLGKRTEFSYDAVGNLLLIRDADAIAAIAANPAMTSAERASLTTRYVYDQRNLLVCETFPRGKAGETRRVYTYDAGGRLATRKVGVADPAVATGFLAGQPVETATYTYDKANRLTKRAYSDGTSDSFTYDSVGRLLTAVSSKYGNTVTRTYDVAGKQITEALKITGGLAQTATVLADVTYTTRSTWDKANRLVKVTYPDNQVVDRTYDARGLLTQVGFPGASVTRTLADNGRLVSTLFGNGLIEQRTYVANANLVERIVTAGVDDLYYQYDSIGRKVAEDRPGDPARSQTFGYDAAGRLTSWHQGLATAPVHTASWTLSAVGDWQTVVRDGLSQARSHSAVHEVTAAGGIALGYDFKGNLTTDLPAAGGTAQTYTWDPENRLARAANLDGVRSRNASYAYDALGRRVAKVVDNVTTTYVHHGAQPIYEIDTQSVPSKTASTQDGTLANLASVPQGLDGQSGAFLAGPVRTSSVAGIIRINFQPVTSPDPAGYLVDRGRTYATRSSNGLSYGWNVAVSTMARQRNMAELPAWDTLIEMGTATWEVALANGDYPVVVVAGDPAMVNQTNNLQLEDQVLTDTDPDPGTAMVAYAQGDFDAWAVIARVRDGKLTLSGRPDAVNPKICLIEIGKAGTALPTDIATRLQDYVTRMTTATAGAGYPVGKEGPRWFVYGDYVDEVVAYRQTVGGVVGVYYPHYNHLYSVAALTGGNAGDAGEVVERYTYDAYGKQKITDASGNVTRVKSAVGFDRGFTGYIADNETGLLHARARQYSPTLGRFVRRDPIGYAGDGFGLYGAYFVPNRLDPSGLATISGILDAIQHYYLGNGEIGILSEGLVGEYLADPGMMSYAHQIQAVRQALLVYADAKMKCDDKKNPWKVIGEKLTDTVRDTGQTTSYYFGGLVGGHNINSNTITYDAYSYDCCKTIMWRSDRVFVSTDTFKIDDSFTDGPGTSFWEGVLAQFANRGTATPYPMSWKWGLEVLGTNSEIVSRTSYPY